MNKKTKRTDELKKFLVINYEDANDTFEIMARDVNDAQFEALDYLGWFVSTDDKE